MQSKQKSTALGLFEVVGLRSRDHFVSTRRRVALLWAYSQGAPTQSNVISLPSPFSRCEKYTYQLRQITVTNFTNMRQLWVYSQWGASTQSSVIGLVFFWQPIFSWKKNKKTCLKIFYWNGLQKNFEKSLSGEVWPLRYGDPTSNHWIQIGTGIPIVRWIRIEGREFDG